MAIKQFQIESREQWLSLRRSDVTASAAGAVLGVHDYMSPLGLFALKSGRVAEDVEETPAMIRGLLLEPVALKLLRMQKPEWQQIEWNGAPGELTGCYYRDEEHRIGATPDCFVLDERGRRGVVQFKSVERSIFKRKWHDSNEDGAVEMRPPLWTALQAIVEADLTGAAFVMVAALVIGFGLDLYVIDVPIHEGVMGRIREAVTDFWRRVAENDPYDPDYAQDGKLIARLYAEDNGTTIDLSADNHLPVLLDEQEQLKATRKAAQDRLDEIKAEVKFKLGPHSAAFVNGWAVTNKMQHRKELVVKAASFRVLRAKRIGQKYPLTALRD